MIVEDVKRQVSIRLLKRKAAKHYTAYHATLDRYDCGRAVASTINPRVNEHAAAFNAAMDELAVLDPACPAHRLEIS